MKHNAYTVGNVILHKVWGDDTMMPEWPLLPDSPVMVIWSPIFRQYICSVTTLDYRYDAFIRQDQFRADGTLSIDAPTYYLDQAKRGSHVPN